MEEPAPQGLKARAVRARDRLRAFYKEHRGFRIASWIAGGVAGTVLVLALAVSIFPWGAFKGEAAAIASAVSGRPIAIDGDLRVKLFSLHPRIEVAGLRIGNPAWAKNEEPLGNIESAAAQIDLWRTITGGLALDELTLEHANINLVKVAPKEANWSTNGEGKSLKLPFIKNFVMKSGLVHYEDRPRGLVLNATFYSSEEADPAASARPFHLIGEGQLNGRKFRLDLVGAPLVNVRRDRPYNFRADVVAGATHIAGYGQLARPLNFADYNANLDATGDDLADMFYLTGLALPNTPPYHLKTVLSHHDNGYDLTGITGMVGASDVHGTLHVVRRNDRPYLTGEMASKSLDISDLYTVLGAAAPKKAAQAAPSQRIEAQKLAVADRIFPDAKLDLKRVRGMDASVKYSSASFHAPGWPLRAFSLSIQLDRGLLTFDPARLDLTQGHVDGVVKLDARQDVPDVSGDLKLAGAGLQNLLGASMKEPPISGALSGRVRFNGKGDTVRKVAATARGQASFVSPHGEIRKALAELTGINLLNGLGLLLAHDESSTNMRCAVADFAIKDGIATPRILVFDTDDVLITGSGSANLGDETLDLQLKGAPKEPRLVRVRAPITLTGHFRSPKIGVKAGAAAGQAGIAGALSAVLTPLAAVLPFIDAGLADDADCGALLAQGKAAKLPAKPG